MDRGAWQATVHGFAKSRTWLKDCHSSLKSLKLKDRWNLRNKSVYLWIQVSSVCTHLGVLGFSQRESQMKPSVVKLYEYLFTLNTFLRVHVSCFPTQVTLNAPRARWQHHSWKRRKLWPWQWDACLDLGRWRIAGVAGGGLCVPGNAALSLREEVPAVGKPGMDASEASPCLLREGSPVPRQDDCIWSLWAVLIPLLQAYLLSLIF